MSNSIDEHPSLYFVKHFEALGSLKSIGTTESLIKGDTKVETHSLQGKENDAAVQNRTKDQKLLGTRLSSQSLVLFWAGPPIF